jgi:hypothetical protein
MPTGRDAAGGSVYESPARLAGASFESISRPDACEEPCCIVGQRGLNREKGTVQGVPSRAAESRVR